MAKTQFNGFPVDPFHFLEEIAINNNREWFLQNKDRHQASVVEPVHDFICAMGDRLDTVSKNFLADPRSNGGSMFRIYRDTRFSKDKRPYKESVGCHFRHVSIKGAHAPCFYLHLQPGNIFAGAGVCKPAGPDLDKIRTAIDAQSDNWKKVLSDKKLVKRFGTISGESLKRLPRGYDADHPYTEDLKHKTFFLKHDMDTSLALTPKFIDQVVKVYVDAAPLMRFKNMSI